MTSDALKTRQPLLRWLGFQCSLGLMHLFEEQETSTVEHCLQGIRYVDAPTAVTGTLRCASESERDQTLNSIRVREPSADSNSEVVILQTKGRVYSFTCSAFASQSRAVPDPQFQAELDVGLFFEERGMVSLLSALRRLQGDQDADPYESSVMALARAARVTDWTWSLHHPGLDTLVLTGRDSEKVHPAYLVFRQPSYVRLAPHMPGRRVRPAGYDDVSRLELPSEAANMFITLLGSVPTEFLVASRTVQFFEHQDLVKLGQPLL